MILLLIVISLILGLFLKYHIVFVLIFFSLFIIYLIYRFKNKRLIILSISIFLIGIGVSHIRFDFNKSVYKGLVIEAKENYVILSSSLEKLYYYEKDNSYEVGDIISIQGNKKEINFTTLESDFDFNYYLDKKGVKYELKANKVEVNFSTFLTTKYLKNDFLSHFSSNASSLLKGILFSDLDDNEVTSGIKELHLARLLSTSGIYISLFNKFLIHFFTYFFKRRTSEIISLSILGVYNIFLFPKFAPLKFIVFGIFKLINEYILHKKFSYITVLCFSALFFIIIDYHLTYSISFILGYTFPLLFYFISKITCFYKKRKRRIISLIIFYIFLIPIDILFYNEFAPLSYLIQLILTPLFMLIGVTGFICLFHIPIYPVVNHLINALINVSSIFSYINIKIYSIPFSETLLALYFIIFIVSLYLYSIKFKPILSFNIVILIVNICIHLIPINNLFITEVIFINVGQGDATLIRKHNTALLIDTGGSIYKDIAKDCLIPLFKKKQIYDIDLLITTHDDFDHSGALTSLMNNFKVNRYIKEHTYFPIEIDGIKLTNYNTYTSLFEEENDESLVIGFNLSNINFLIMGDAPKKIENKIMEDYTYIPCDILKVGHHGSNTSSSSAFLNYLSPKEAIISCGMNNKYGHPHKDVINNLRRKNITIKRTDKMGSICYSV